MNTRVTWVAMAAAAAALIVGFQAEHVYAAPANQAPIASGGSLTVHYEDAYTIHFTASDPDGDALTVVTQPINDDWFGCDGGPATDFTCEYSSSRYYDPAPLPTDPFQRTISYTVTDGISTSTGEWIVTVLPPPTMRITGTPTVTEGGDAVLQLELSSNRFGPLMVVAHVSPTNGAGDATTPVDLVVEVADGQTTTPIHVPTTDDTIAGPPIHFSVSVAPADAIPYRFVPGGNLVTVLDNDSKVPSDTTPPLVAKHRDLLVERGGKQPARVPFESPTATDDVDGVVPTSCAPGSMSVMPIGGTKVTCSASDTAGNTASSTFDVTVRRSMSGGSAEAIGGHGDHQCAAPGQILWITAEGFTPGAQVTIHLLASDQELIKLQTARADRKGRIRQIVTTPGAAPGDADIVVTGPTGGKDLVRMLPLRVARGHHHHGGGVIALLRHRDCD